MKYTFLVSLLFCAFVFCKNQTPSFTDDRPNIVLILADDLGYSDLGCFGSEIETPNIDAIADQGQIFNQFYTSATCSPTRAMLLTGTDNHIAGLGDMAERVLSIPAKQGQPGYEGFLNNKVVSFAQLLIDSGYRTYMAGKWHLGIQPENSPKAHGFERSFSLLNAASNHFYPNPESDYFWADNGYTEYPNGQFSSDLYTDKLLAFLDRDRNDHRPFFMYAAYTAPHWPLQAPKEYIEKYKGKYDLGFDSLRIMRFEGLKKTGIVDKDMILPQRPAVKGTLYRITDHPLLSWTSLSEDQKRLEARKMEIYAAMIDNMDHNIGRLVSYLKSIGQYDNTLIIFCSDNGAAVAEANSTPDPSDPFPYMGSYNSFVAYGPQWAHASTAAFQLYKGYTREGGIRSPLIVKKPYQKARNAIIPALSTIMDIAPTILETAGINYPESYKKRPLSPQKGKSMWPILEGTASEIHEEDEAIGWELFERCALRKGKWKITKIEAPFGTGEFELFNINEDPGETHNLSQSHPKIYNDMLSEWQQYVQDNGVILIDRY